MLSREAADTTKGDPEHTGAVHAASAECHHSELILCARAVTLMWGCKNKGVYSLWLHVPWEVGAWLSSGSRISTSPGSLLTTHQPSAARQRVLFLHSQVPHVFRSQRDRRWTEKSQAQGQRSFRSSQSGSKLK